MTPIERAFESWHRATQANPLTKDGEGEYGNAFTNARWEAWQAALAALRAQPAPIPYSGADENPPVFGRCWKLARDGFGLERDDMNGNYVHIDDALSVLHAAQPDHRELVKDAVRYRWLRTWEIDSYLATGKLEQLDAEIDRAMAADALEGK